MITAAALKAFATGRLGADLCGVAGVARFAGAPAGFHPADVYPGVRAVVALAKALPEGVMRSPSPVPYTAAGDWALAEVHRVSWELCRWLEDRGAVAVPIPSEPYEHWDPELREGRGILSLKHAARLAGLGALGRNTLLTHPRFGNRLVLGALLTDAVLDADDPLEWEFCDDACGRCLDDCPAGALDGTTADQKRCRAVSGVVTPKGYPLYTCNRCRRLCPQGHRRPER